MTEKIKCPCCGSEKHSPRTYADPDSVERICNLCFCLWHQSKRKPVSGWISCSEQLPPKYEAVLIYYRGRCIKMARLSGDGYWYTNESSSCLLRQDITHWQPLPEPPAGKDLE